MSKKLTTPKIWWRQAIEVAIAIILPLGGGFLVSMFTRSAMTTFNAFKQPLLAPPAWAFPVAWSILYVLMGIASYLIYRLKQSPARSTALKLYVGQLVLNFCWTLIFFNLGWHWPALIWLLAMWGLILALVMKAKELSKSAFYMLLPYLAWCTFAAYLNLGIALLN